MPKTKEGRSPVEPTTGLADDRKELHNAGEELLLSHAALPRRMRLDRQAGSPYTEHAMRSVVMRSSPGIRRVAVSEIQLSC
jgi:hypothetical protein